jgi:hypothetical protein
MKLFMTVLTMIFVSGAAQFVYAADEFGERFGEGSPAALREPAPEEEINPQDIEPAAGDEEAPAVASGNIPAAPANDAEPAAAAEAATDTPDSEFSPE